MKRELVYQVIDSERKYQIAKWGRSNDNYKPVESFLVYIEYYVRKAMDRISQEPHDKGALEELRKVVALGVACFEQHGVLERDDWQGPSLKPEVNDSN